MCSRVARLPIWSMNLISDLPGRSRKGAGQAISSKNTLSVAIEGAYAFFLSISRAPSAHSAVTNRSWLSRTHRPGTSSQVLVKNGPGSFVLGKHRVTSFTDRAQLDRALTASTTTTTTTVLPFGLMGCKILRTYSFSCNRIAVQRW